MSEIDFEAADPIWQVEFYHNTPDTSGYWTRALNAKTELEAIDKALVFYEADGLPLERITRTQTWELKTL